MDNLFTKDQLEPNVIEYMTEDIGRIDNLPTESRTLVSAVNEVLGKQIIAKAVGEPLSKTDKFSEMGNKLDTMTNKMKTKLNGIGVGVVENEKMNSMIDKIDGLINPGAVTDNNARCDVLQEFTQMSYTIPIKGHGPGRFNFEWDDTVFWTAYNTNISRVDYVNNKVDYYVAAANTQSVVKSPLGDYIYYVSAKNIYRQDITSTTSTGVVVGTLTETGQSINISTDGTKLLIGTTNSKIICVDVGTYSELWKYVISTTAASVSDVFINKKNVIITSSAIAGPVHVLDIEGNVIRVIGVQVSKFISDWVPSLYSDKLFLLEHDGNASSSIYQHVVVDYMTGEVLTSYNAGAAGYVRYTPDFDEYGEVFVVDQRRLWKLNVGLVPSVTSTVDLGYCKKMAVRDGYIMTGTDSVSTSSTVTLKILKYSQKIVKLNNLK